MEADRGEQGGRDGGRQIGESMKGGRDGGRQIGESMEGMMYEGKESSRREGKKEGRQAD